MYSMVNSLYYKELFFTPPKKCGVKSKKMWSKVQKMWSKVQKNVE